MIDTKDVGLDLAVSGSVISAIGVFYNNVLLDHTMAMWLWIPSNFLFVIYFSGRARNWWDGGISDTVMCGLYLMMLLSGVYGLMK